MRKVFVLKGVFDTEESDILGVFSTKEKAQAAKEEGCRRWRYDEIKIEAITLECTDV